MMIQSEHYVLDVDLEATRAYSGSHSLCDCDEDRNFYAQARTRFPKLTAFLSVLGLLIDRPDEIGSFALDDMIDYHFVAYTVVGKIPEPGEYEIELHDGGQTLKIVISNWYVPNEQETQDYFTVAVLNIRLPWVLDAPFPAAEVERHTLFSRAKAFLSRIF